MTYTELREHHQGLNEVNRQLHQRIGLFAAQARARSENLRQLERAYAQLGAALKALETVSQNGEVEIWNTSPCDCVTIRFYPDSAPRRAVVSGATLLEALLKLAPATGATR